MGVTYCLVFSVRLVTRDILRKKVLDGGGKVPTQGGYECTMLGNKWVKS